MIGPVIRNAVRDLGEHRHFIALHLSCGHAERRPATCECMARLYCWHPDCERTRVVLHVERVP